MTAKPTLRALSGMHAIPAPLSKSALVLVDCQQTYRSGVLRLEGVEEALLAAQKVLHRARSVGAPVIHIVHDDGPGSLYDTSGETGRIAEVVAPTKEEVVITKHWPNAFLGTDLQAQLKVLGVENLVLVGFMTHMCISSTARGAFNLGLNVAIVASATATRSLPDADGNSVSAGAIQVATLAGLADLFATIVNDGEGVPT